MNPKITKFRPLKSCPHASGGKFVTTSIFQIGYRWVHTNISMGNSNSILFCFFKKLFYHYIYHFTIFSTFQNYIFIKILFFNLSLLFFSNHHFFLDLVFRFPTVIFFPFFLPQPLAPVQHTKPHTHTHPWYTDQPIQTHHHTEPHTHIQTQTIIPSTEPHTHKPSNQLEPTTATTPITQATDQQIQAIDQKPTPPIWNPSRRKYPEKRRWSTQKNVKNTQATNQKPTPPIFENTQKNADDQSKKNRKYPKIPKPLIRNPSRQKYLAKPKPNQN